MCTTAWRYILPFGIASGVNSSPFFCLICRWRVWCHDRVGWGSTTEIEQQLCLRQIFQIQLEFPKNPDPDLFTAQNNSTWAMVESKQMLASTRTRLCRQILSRPSSPPPAICPGLTHTVVPQTLWLCCGYHSFALHYTVQLVWSAFSIYSAWQLWSNMGLKWPDGGHYSLSHAQLRE